MTYCEHPDGNGIQCGNAAAWVVQVGTRRADKQLSCGRHLHRTCEAMSAGEAPRNAALTVTPVGEWGPLMGGAGG